MAAVFPAAAVFPIAGVFPQRVCSQSRVCSQQGPCSVFAKKGSKNRKQGPPATGRPAGTTIHSDRGRRFRSSRFVHAPSGMRPGTGWQQHCQPERSAEPSVIVVSS